MEIQEGSPKTTQVFEGTVFHQSQFLGDRDNRHSTVEEQLR